MTKKQSRTRGFGKRSMSVLLAVLLLLSTMAVMLTATSLSASAMIRYWQVAGNFNNWEQSLGNTSYRINGSSGSVTIAMTASSIKFKMVANENDNDYWCGNESGSTTVGTETMLKWSNESPNNDIECALPANTVSVTFTLAVKSGKNYVTVTANTSGGGGGGGSDSDLKFTAPVNSSNSANNGSIFWADATYYDYLSDEELSSGWLKPVHAGTSNFNGAIDEWYPFYIYNRDVIKSVADSNSGWSKPLYFGNFCNTYNAYDTSHHPGVTNGYTDATGSVNVTRFDYAANNSNGVYDRYTSVQGLMGQTLTNSGQLQTPNGTVAPYFDEATLGNKARVVDSKFPFRIIDKGTYKRYEFDSTNATDNVYFTWETSGGKTYPKYVNYGAGTAYGVKDGIKDFMNTESGYGIFPFNNASSSYKGSRTYANDNLDYGFGIRMDVKFRVPANTDVKFDFSGDDDLWMYITDETTNQSQLVLDMGGSHKESEGVVDFNAATATVYKVDDRSASNKDIWIMDTSNWGKVLIYAWDNSGHSDWYYGDQSSNLYRFRDTLTGANTGKPLGEMVNFLFAKNTSYDGNSGDLSISSRAGKCSYTDNVGYTNTDHVEGGHSVERVNNFDFDASHTYTMTIFYMERGLIESNCKMGFTLTPLGNQVTVEKEVNTASINRTASSTQLQDEVETIDSFDFIGYQSNSASGTFTAMKNTEYMDNAYGISKTNAGTGAFPLMNNEEASFPSQFTTNNYIKIAETDPNNGSYLRYNTTWSVSDPQDSSRNLTNQSGLSSTAIQLKNPSGDAYDYAQLDYKFINTPKTGDVSVTKTMNSTVAADLSKEFNAKVEISLMGANGTFRAYPLTYSASDKSGTFETDSNGNLSSSALLKHGRTLTFEDLPANAVVKVTEVLSGSEQLLYTPTYPGGNTVTVPSDSTGAISIENTPITPDSIQGEVEGTKTLDGFDYTGDMFRFVLEGVPRFSGDAANVKDTSSTVAETTSVNNGVFKFAKLTFSEAGIYRYHVYEDMSYLEQDGNTFDTDFVGINTEYLIKFTVIKGTDNKLRIDSTDYYTYSSYEDENHAIPHTMSSADFDASKAADAIEIENELKTGKIRVEKKGAKGEMMNDVVFDVIKVDAGIQNIMDTYTTDAERYEAIKTYMRTHSNLFAGGNMTGEPGVDGTPAEEGVAIISDLSIYEDGFVTTNGAGVSISSAVAPVYQKYILIESSGPTNYSINKTINMFSFPINGSYDFTFSEDRAYVNGTIKHPDASGPGMLALKIAGLAIILFSAAALGFYVLNSRRKAHMPAHMRRK